MDMRMLLAGKKIPIIKKKNDWRLSLDNLLGGKLDVSEERDDEDGLGYAQYLAAVMIYVTHRTRHFAQWQLRKCT